MKKLFVVLGLIALFLSFLLGYCNAKFSSSDVDMDLLYNFYKSDYYQSKDGNFSLRIEYYSEEEGIKLLNEDGYSIVKNNVANIKNYIKLSLDKMEEIDNSFNFDYDDISEDDYFIYSSGDGSSLKYYDKGKNISYFIYNYDKNIDLVIEYE